MVAQPSTLRAYTKTGRHVVKLQLGLQKQQHAIRTRRTQIGGRARAARRAEVCAFRMALRRSRWRTVGFLPSATHAPPGGQPRHATLGGNAAGTRNSATPGRTQTEENIT